MVCVGVEERRCDGVCGLIASPSSFFSSFSSLVGGVRGSARAALRARTLSPNTIVFLALYCLLPFSLCLAFLPSSFFAPPLFFCCYGMAVCDLPCVGVFGGHDGDGESVSFVLGFLVVACSAFSVSAVAASAVAFGAEDSSVVWVVGSA